MKRSASDRWREQHELLDELNGLLEQRAAGQPESYERLARRAFKLAHEGVAFAVLVNLTTLEPVWTKKRRLASVNKVLNAVDRVSYPRLAARSELRAHFGAQLDRPADQQPLPLRGTLAHSILLASEEVPIRIRVRRLQELREETIAQSLPLLTLIADLFLLAEAARGDDAESVRRLRNEIRRIEDRPEIGSKLQTRISEEVGLRFRKPSNFWR